MTPEEAKQAYDELIAEAREMNLKKTKEVYTEVHHILPKSLGGDNSPENKVRMLGRKHFEAHWLLTHVWEESSRKYNKMVKALHKMSFGIHKDEYRIMADEYEHIRTLNRNALYGDNNPSKRPEVRKKISNKLTGVKHSEERKAIECAAQQELCKKPETSENRRIAALKRPPVSAETRKKRSQQQKGKKPGNFGKQATPKARQNMSDAQLIAQNRPEVKQHQRDVQTGKKRTSETKKKIKHVNIIRWKLTRLAKRLATLLLIHDANITTSQV